jgi:hypothetical protein
MAIVAGFDVHRAQITFDALDTETGEVHRGGIPAEPKSVRAWVGRASRAGGSTSRSRPARAGCSCATARGGRGRAPGRDGRGAGPPRQ